MKKLLLGLLILLLGTALLFSACKSSTTSATTKTTAASSKTTAASSSQANWWDSIGTPEYGGTINLRTSNLDNVALDPTGMSMGAAAPYERLFGASWTVDRSIFPFASTYTPSEYMQCWLAESWENTDATTVVIHLRQGVQWMDNTLSEVREFTAEDVQYNYDRFLGTGSGFTEPNPFYSAMISHVEKVTAIDTYTVQFKFKKVNALAIYDMFTPQVAIAFPDWLSKYGSLSSGFGGAPGGDSSSGAPGGDASGSAAPASTSQSADWTTYITTGPYMITDFVVGSTLTYTKLDNYYGFDERHPQNRLPYIDTVNYVAVPDISTAVAAFRTYKIDSLGGGAGGSVTWQQLESLKKTNPDLRSYTSPSEGVSISLRVDKSPFGDIRVRQALQMAIDREAIATSHYGGTVDGVPCGLIMPIYTGWCTPYAEWSTDLQEIYSYNPTKAKQLLTEAGYAKGFSTDIIASTNSNVDLLQIIKAEFLDIGVDMEIKTMDQFAAQNYVGAGKHDQMSYNTYTGNVINPWQQITVLTTGDSQNFVYHNDADFDALYQKIVNATTEADAKQYTNEADQYALKQCWVIFVCPSANISIMQPYVKGFMGDSDQLKSVFNLSRWWVDQDLKKSMGR